MSKSIAIFASGTGSNFQALVNAFAGRTDIVIRALVCDHADAPVVAKATRAQIPVIVVDYRTAGSKTTAERRILAQLPPIDLIVLAGYMRILGPTLLNAYPQRIINLHPALLPSFPGRTGIEDAWHYGVKVTGVTVHYVDAGVDSGQIIAQVPVPITTGMSLEDLTAQIHRVEHQLLPATVRQLVQGGTI
ncbi:phosphoribosylglycinamide formyltransferase [Lacticaseibacillus thailandensis]|uniref:Phosphoribosylglycinamide formyltransferase n=1 Tax=Lacticaseibacillus thailandensis DSM 22698 = JCM 13996 TaxID=1423810 RepID=A0A0R2CAG0_9LACO|nr:phosphoribosylglycinamide formyltransferase [Lacticaseibacillus thailandensis]KRM88362.1 Folate-dependent phosphoribosylglycinamide formyltransferase PurN [Lacticaseibacillus thailandensis DSM 22698 = JCM 13996]